MKRVPHNRLLGSKWTAVVPEQREKHFEVIRVMRVDADVNHVVLRALLSKAERTVSVSQLDDAQRWQAGWR